MSGNRHAAHLSHIFAKLGITSRAELAAQAAMSVLQAEFSLTQVLDSAASGRIFFDQLIRDNLDIGRPDRVSLIFGRRIIRKGRRATPGRFRTRILSDRWVAVAPA